MSGAGDVKERVAGGGEVARMQGNSWRWEVSWMLVGGKIDKGHMNGFKCMMGVGLARPGMDGGEDGHGRGNKWRLCRVWRRTRLLK